MDTRERQMKMWTDVILAYCKSKGLYSISLGELYASEICQNQTINRKLSMESLTQICDWMEANKFGEYTSQSKERVFVYWRSI